MILEIYLIPADDLMVQHLYRTIISRRRSAGRAKFINVRYDSAPYNQSTARYRTVLSSAGAGILAQSS